MDSGRRDGSINPMKLRLSAFSAEALHSIAWYLDGDGLFYLLCTGDAVLRAKLRQMRSLTVLWQNPAFCQWDRCLPFIASFSGVCELSFRAASLYQLTKTPLKLNWLSSELTSLELRFRGALDLLRVDPSYHAAADFSKLVSLKSLFIEQLTNEEATYNGLHDLSRLPPNLEHLHIDVPESSWYRHAVSDWGSLPTSLRTYSVPLRTEVTSAKIRSVAFGKTSSHLPNLTHLYVYPPNGCFLDITSVASTLKRLKVRGAASYQGHPLFLSRNRLGPAVDPAIFNDWAMSLTKTLASQGHTLEPVESIRAILPRLESLELPKGLFLAWDFIGTLPLSMTRLHGQFVRDPLYDDLKTYLSRLNLHYIHSVSQKDRPFAPLLFRDFVNHGEAFTALEPFSGLDAAYLPSARLSVENLPERTRSATVHTLKGDFGHLPRNMTSLRCQNLEIPLGSVSASSQLLDNIPTLTPLSSLTISDFALSEDVVALLPATLQQLSVMVVMESALQALRRKADEAKKLPGLTFLSLELAPYRSAAITVSLDTIPSSIATLQLRGETPIFPPTSSGNSLRHHPSLTDLHCASSQLPELIFGQLPSQLLYFRTMLASPIDLNIESVIQDLLSLPPRLRSFGIQTPSSTQGRWMMAAHRKSLTLSRKLLFAGKHPTALGIMLVVPSALWTDHLVHRLSENFVLSCLPPTVVDLQLNLANYPLHLIGDPFGHFLLQIIETRPKSVWNGIKRLLITRCPLLGLPLQTEPTLRIEPIADRMSDLYMDSRVERLPLHLSWLNTPTESIRDAHRNFALGRPKAPGRQYFTGDWHSRRLCVERLGYHSINLLVMLHFTYLFSIERTTHPIAWCYHWANIIGSGVYIPLLIRGALRGSGSLPSHFSLEVSVVGALFTLINWTTGVAGAIALGYSATRWGWPSRTIALATAVFGESFIQFLLRGVY